MSSDDAIRSGLFALVFLVIAWWEILAPRRNLNFSRNIRWFNNIGMSLLNQLLLRWCFPVLLVGLAVVVQQREWGLFNLLEVPEVLAITLCLLLLDLAIYIQHIVFHRVTWLWRLHRVHHSDLDFDVTTAVRFHPLEIILSMSIKMALVLLLGAPPLAVLIFEIILSVTALFNHGNIFIPVRLDRILRWALVTPDMHRVHHSAKTAETNSNFGFNLPWWDHLFKTYCPQPGKGHEEMTVGLEEFRSEDKLLLPALLLLPFRKR
jgi:sterol desaturase/sphingolipid hydroxylase (fatty acid hydroxylase superfamily)